MNSLQQNGLATRLPSQASRYRRAFSLPEHPGSANQRMSAGFLFLSAFFLVYCMRPEDWVPGLKYIPLAKITAGGAILALFFTASRAERKLKELPREAKYLFALICVLSISAVFSPVWRGGAVSHTIDFAKVFIVFVLVFLFVTNIPRLRRIIFVQSASLILLTIISMAKGHNRPRLEGVIGGVYSNPNDLAFAIVLCIPYCLAFLVTSKSLIGKIAWASGILTMLTALFLTASRAGFIDLVVSGTVCLWHFGVKGRRFYLLLITAVLGTVLIATVGKKLVQRFEAISEQTQGDSAYGSYEARKELMVRAIHGIERYPILGIGVNNFVSYSGMWHEVHMTYLQIAVEGGIPSLILYLLFFACGFRNLRQLRKRRDLPIDFEVFVGAMHASLIGFVVGAIFGPEAYHFFPFFAVAYTSAMMATLKEMDAQAAKQPPDDGLIRRTTRTYGAEAKWQRPVTVPR